MNVRISKEQKIKVLNADDVYKIMQAILLRENKIRRAQEHFWIIGMNNANKILFIELLCLGANNRVNIGPPDVFRMAIYKLASKAILVHNHPSGEIKPSSEDKQLTDYMLKAGKFLRIEVLDHLIITENKFASFEEMEIMDELRNNGNFEIVKAEKEELIAFRVKIEAERAEKKKALEIAFKMLNKNEPIEKIIEYTGLRKEQIEKIKVTQ